MMPDDLPAAQDLSRAVGWPHRVEDWQFSLSVGEGLVACAGGRIVGTIMWWRYQGRQARVGMVIVDPAIQRAGIGATLMREVLGRIAEPQVVLNATEAGEGLYRRLGFATVGRILQHQGTAGSVPPPPLGRGRRVRPAGRNDTDRMIALDSAALGAERAAVIRGLVEAGEAVVLADGGETAGFAFCRRFGRGHVIGPVVAPDVEAARTLIAHWIGSRAGQFTRIDVAGDSGLSDWLDDLGLARVEPALTMVRGEPLPAAGIPRAFAVVNQALG